MLGTTEDEEKERSVVVSCTVCVGGADKTGGGGEEGRDRLPFAAFGSVSPKEQRESVSFFRGVRVRHEKEKKGKTSRKPFTLAEQRIDTGRHASPGHFANSPVDRHQGREGVRGGRNG